MTSWADFVSQAPQLSAYMQLRISDDATGRITYVATVRKDGGPRVHPVKIFPAGDGLFLYMYPESPKGLDLQRDPRIALHAAVTPNPFESGELAAWGTTTVITDPQVRTVANAAAPFASPPPEENVLYEISLDLVIGTPVIDGKPVHLRWRSRDGVEEDIGFGGRDS